MHQLRVTVVLETEHVLVIWMFETRLLLISRDSDLIIHTRVQSPLLIHEEGLVLPVVIGEGQDDVTFSVLAPRAVKLSVLEIEATNVLRALEVIMRTSWSSEKHGLSKRHFSNKVVVMANSFTSSEQFETISRMAFELIKLAGLGLPELLFVRF